MVRYPSISHFIFFLNGTYKNALDGVDKILMYAPPNASSKDTVALLMKNLLDNFFMKDAWTLLPLEQKSSIDMSLGGNMNFEVDGQSSCWFDWWPQALSIARERQRSQAHLASQCGQSARLGPIVLLRLDIPELPLEQIVDAFQTRIQQPVLYPTWQGGVGLLLWPTTNPLPIDQELRVGNSDQDNNTEDLAMLQAMQNLSLHRSGSISAVLQSFLNQYHLTDRSLSPLHEIVEPDDLQALCHRLTLNNIAARTTSLASSRRSQNISLKGNPGNDYDDAALYPSLVGLRTDHHYHHRPSSVNDQQMHTHTKQALIDLGVVQGSSSPWQDEYETDWHSTAPSPSSQPLYKYRF